MRSMPACLGRTSLRVQSSPCAGPFSRESPASGYAAIFGLGQMSSSIGRMRSRNICAGLSVLAWSRWAGLVGL